MAESRKKNPAAVALGRLGGKKRAANLSAEELSDQGKRAAAARWSKSKLAAESEGHGQMPDSTKPEAVPMPEPARLAEATQVQESNGRPRSERAGLLRWRTCRASGRLHASRGSLA
jgi:hypothetical protein